MTILRFFDRLLLRWNREHSHVLMACGFGSYLWLAQSFSQSPGPGMRALGNLAQAIAPEVDAEALWGSLMIGGGGLALLGLLTGQVRLRQIAGALLVALWLLMAGCFFQANPHSPGAFMWAVFAWSSFTRIYQLSRRDPSSPNE